MDCVRPALSLDRAFLHFLLFFVVTSALQFTSGSYESELGGDPDEPSHFVTGLMVGDYISALAPDSPMRFASNYYLHYPKVGLGHWPPLFYLVQAGWLLLFPASQVSVMALMAVLTAGLATMVCQAVRKELSTMEGVAVGVLLVCTPLVQLHSRMVMAEILETALVFWATLAFKRTDY